MVREVYEMISRGSCSSIKAILTSRSTLSTGLNPEKKPTFPCPDNSYGTQGYWYSARATEWFAGKNSNSIIFMHSQKSPAFECFQCCPTNCIPDSGLDCVRNELEAPLLNKFS